MKIKRIILALLVLALFITAFAACDGSPETTTEQPDTSDSTPVTADPNHEHVWELDEAASVLPTCIKIGSNTYKCTVSGCTETKKEKVAKLEHVADGPATCQKKSLCTLCGKMLADITDHTYGDPVVVEATCTTDGTSTLKCTVCGFEKVTTLSHEDAHDFEETLDPTGTYVTKVCKKCGYTVTSVDFQTILKYDFETEDTIKDYLSAPEGFFVANGSHSTSLGATPLVEEGTGNRYAHIGGPVFIQDENLVFLKTDKFYVEYDVKFDKFPSGANKSVFTFLPNWSAENKDKMTWMWFMKINSESQDDAKTVTPGEFVTYKNCSGDKLNTGKILEEGKWYHFTMAFDWTTHTAQIYIGERGSGENLFVATASMDFSDEEVAGVKSGVPATTREEQERFAFRFCDGGVTADFDNVHFYTAAKPLWDK